MTERAGKKRSAHRAGQLRERIAHHRKRYYVDDDPEVSDGEYDALERELRQIEKQYPDLVTSDSPTLRTNDTHRPSGDKQTNEHPDQAKRHRRHNDHRFEQRVVLYRQYKKHQYD